MRYIPFETADGKAFVTGDGLVYSVEYNSEGYKGLITSQHKTKQNFMAIVDFITQYSIDTQEVLLDFDFDFDLDLASGLQLDIIGECVGVKRLLDFQPTGGISPILDDDAFRTVIKAKIAQNQWNGTIGGIYTLWDTLFAPRLKIIVRDNQDMSMTVLVLGNVTPLEIQLINKSYIIPKPEGVQLIIGTPDYPIFAFDENVDNYQGFGTGKWFVSI